MPGETDLKKLLTVLKPELLPETYVFVCLPCADAAAHTKQALAIFHEAEGVTLVLPETEASGLAHEGPFRCITLTVQSSLAAVGLTAAVANALAAAGISANVWAAFHHDHIFVPQADADHALTILRALSDA